MYENKNFSKSAYPNNFTSSNHSPNFSGFKSRYLKAGILISPQNHQYETLNSFQYPTKNCVKEKKEKIIFPKKLKSAKVKSGYNSYFFKSQEKNEKNALMHDDEQKKSQIFKLWDSDKYIDDFMLHSSLNLKYPQTAIDKRYPENNLIKKEFSWKNLKESFSTLITSNSQISLNKKTIPLEQIPKTAQKDNRKEKRVKKMMKIKHFNLFRPSTINNLHMLKGMFEALDKQQKI